MKAIFIFNTNKNGNPKHSSKTIEQEEILLDEQTSD